jgi:galactokinase/mevalonate kinase-like predicted kinase
MIIPESAREALAVIHQSVPLGGRAKTETALVRRVEHVLAKRLESGATTGITIGSVAAGILLIIFGALFLRRIRLRRELERAQLSRKPEIDVDI